MQPIEVAEKKQFEQLQQSIMIEPDAEEIRHGAAGIHGTDEEGCRESINSGMAGKIAPEIAAGDTQPTGGGASKIILET